MIKAELVHNGQCMLQVAADAVGAGLDEVVMYATGSSARQTVLTDRRPCDAAIMAIVDTWEVNGDMKYQKVEPLPDLRGFD